LNPASLDIVANVNDNYSHCDTFLSKLMYVCVCNAVTEREIRQAAGLGVTTVRELKRSLGVATGCGKCAPCAHAVLRDELANSSSASGTLAPMLGT
jgi:bacterioferritin-associated ferredoxin